MIPIDLMSTLRIGVKLPPQVLLDRSPQTYIIKYLSQCDRWDFYLFSASAISSIGFLNTVSSFAS